MTTETFQPPTFAPEPSPEELAGAAVMARLAEGPPDRTTCTVPGCGFEAKTLAGLAAHGRAHASGGKAASGPSVPPSDAKGAQGGRAAPARRPGPSEMDLAKAWIETNVQPNLLQAAAALGIPKPILAAPKLDTETGLTVWPGPVSELGRLVQLDEMAVTVYAAAYVYGRDTWLAEYLQTYGQKALPVALAIACAWVTFMHIGKIVTIQRQIGPLVAQMAEAERQAQAAAQQAQAA